MNPNIKALNVICAEILQSNFVSAIDDEGECRLCNSQHPKRYRFVNGYSQELSVCAICAVFNIPFMANANFRLNGLTKGFLIFNSNTDAHGGLTIITTQASIAHIDESKADTVSWVIAEKNLYSTLIETIKQSRTLNEKCFIIELKSRMHQFAFDIQASIKGNLYIASERSAVRINTDLLDQLIQKYGRNNHDQIVAALKKNIVFLDKPTLQIYQSIIKEV